MSEVPLIKFNLVIYKEKGRRLEKPTFLEGVYLLQDGDYLSAFKADKFDEDSIEASCRVINTTFLYCGIRIEGLEYIDGVLHHQNWLATLLSEEKALKL